MRHLLEIGQGKAVSVNIYSFEIISVSVRYQEIHKILYCFKKTLRKYQDKVSIFKQTKKLKELTVRIENLWNG